VRLLATILVSAPLATACLSVPESDPIDAQGNLVYLPFEGAAAASLVNLADGDRATVRAAEFGEGEPRHGQALVAGAVLLDDLPAGLRPPLTIEAWIRTASEDVNCLVVLSNADFERQADVAFEVRGDGLLSLGTVDNVRAVAFDTDPVGDDRWHHVAVTWDGEPGTDGAVAFFVDAVEQAPLTLTVPSDDADHGDYAVRERRDAAAECVANGAIDEVKLSSRIKTQAEIEASMNAAPP
jgi:hypothetical protein